MELAQVENSNNTMMETADAVMKDPLRKKLLLIAIFTGSEVHQNQKLLPAIPWKVSGLDVLTTQIDKISTVMVQHIHSHVLTTSKD